jgi:hypothetical protein
MWSINIGEAAFFANSEFECDGWYVTSVERVFDEDFFKNIDPTEGLQDETDEEEEVEEEADTDSLFLEIMRNIDWQ